MIKMMTFEVFGCWRGVETLVMPKIYPFRSFKDVNNDISATNWLLVIFIDPSIDIEITLKIWDAFLCEGNKVLIRWVLAIYMYHEKRLMNAKDQGQVMQILRYYKIEQKVMIFLLSDTVILTKMDIYFRSLTLYKTWLIIA